MSTVSKVTLAKEIDGVVDYIYPRTSADVTEYDADSTVKDKLDYIIAKLEELETKINDLNDTTTTTE